MTRDDPDWRLRDLPRMQIAPAVRWGEVPEHAFPQLTDAERVQAGMAYALAHYHGLSSAVARFVELQVAGVDVTEFMRRVDSVWLTSVGPRRARSRSLRQPHPPVKAIGRHGSRVQRARARNRGRGDWPRKWTPVGYTTDEPDWLCRHSTTVSPFHDPTSLWYAGGKET